VKAISLEVRARMQRALDEIVREKTLAANLRE